MTRAVEAIDPSVTGQEAGAPASVSGTGAEILTEALAFAGVRHIFGVPGDTGVAFYDALYHRQDRLHHVLARDERHAATMADVYARVTNTVGVVEVSSGGGTTFAVGGLGEPYASSVPMLLLTSDIHRRSRNTGALTEIDQERLFAAVTKWLARAETAAEIPALVAEALWHATTGRPGPAALIVPEDVLDEPTHTTLLPPGRTTNPRLRPEASPVLVAEAARALAFALQPAVVAGSGVHLSGAWAELAALAERGGIPVATTLHGKGGVPETHPWCLGVVGANGARDYANAYLEHADVVLFVGTRANATDTNGFRSPSRQATVFQVDIAAERAGWNYPRSTGLVGDARAVLAQLLTLLPAADPARAARLRACIEPAASMWMQHASAPAAHGPDYDPGDGRLDPRQVVRLLRETAGPAALLVADPGTPTPNVGAYWESRAAGREVVIPRGHGPMGYAIPGAVGAAFAAPGRPVVALTADGSFAMACGELETAARYALPIVYVQLTNHSLGWIKMLQHLYMERRYFGVDPGPIDAVSVARAAGLPALRARSLDELESAVRAAVASGHPAYIEVEVPDQLTLVSPVAPWHAALDGEALRPVY